LEPFTIAVPETLLCMARNHFDDSSILTIFILRKVTPMKRVLMFCVLLGVSASHASNHIPDSLNPYVRKPKSAAVSVEAGSNSLASLVGFKATVFIDPQFAVDLGLGASLVGFRPGIYARYLFSKAKLAPFVYGGFKYGMGFDTPIEMEDEETGQLYEMTIDPSPYADFGFGLDYLANFGFYLNAGIGWSQLLGGNNIDYVSGATPTQEDQDINEIIAGSGLGLFLSLGYAF